MKKWRPIALFVLVLLAVAVLANVLTPEPWREHVLNVSELLGALIALLGVPYLVHELAGLKNRTVSAADLRETLEKSLKEKIEEWFPVCNANGRQGEADGFDVHIVSASQSWSDLFRKYEQDAIDTRTKITEKLHHSFYQREGLNKLHIRAQYEDQSVVCWSECQRFCPEDGIELEEKLKTLPECRIFRELSKLLSKNSTP